MAVYFISGHKSLTKQEFELHYVPLLLEAIIKNLSSEFLIGNQAGKSDGVEAWATEWLIARGIDPSRITVHIACRALAHRLKLVESLTKRGILVKCGYQSCFELRNTCLTLLSTHDLAWVRPKLCLPPLSKDVKTRKQTSKREWNYYPTTQKNLDRRTVLAVKSVPADLDRLSQLLLSPLAAQQIFHYQFFNVPGHYSTRSNMWNPRASHPFNPSSLRKRLSRVEEKEEVAIKSAIDYTQECFDESIFYGRKNSVLTQVLVRITPLSAHVKQGNGHFLTVPSIVSLANVCANNDFTLIGALFALSPCEDVSFATWPTLAHRTHFSHPSDAWLKRQSFKPRATCMMNNASFICSNPNDPSVVTNAIAQTFEPSILVQEDHTSPQIWTSWSKGKWSRKQRYVFTAEPVGPGGSLLFLHLLTDPCSTPTHALALVSIMMPESKRFNNILKTLRQLSPISNISILTIVAMFAS